MDENDDAYNSDLLLIDLVEQRRFLYDKAHPEYRNKDLKMQSFQHIGEVLNADRKLNTILITIYQCQQVVQKCWLLL